MSEHDEQVQFFDILRLNYKRHPQLESIFAVPNGGHRHKATAVKLKREGVMSGVFDICVPVASSGYHGAFIEMKFGKNTLTKEQVKFCDMVEANGYFCEIAYSAEEACQILADYLELEFDGVNFK